MQQENSLSDPAAFDRLYHEQGSPVRKFLRVSIGNSSVADDLTQETFLHVWRRSASFDPARGGIKAYLLGIARKKAADWWRRNKADPVAAAEPAAHSADTVAIKNAFDQLPPDLRTVLWLREVEGYSYEELAQIINIPVGTVRSRLHSARQQLRTIWTKEAQ